MVNSWYNIMIKYDWEKIKQRANGKPKGVIAILKYLTSGLGTKDTLKYLNGKDLTGISGDSFLLNPGALWADKSATEGEILLYIHLASLRNLLFYKLNGEVSLPLIHADMHEKYITQNRLLAIVDTKIHFKHEDNKNGNFIW